MYNIKRLLQVGALQDGFSVAALDTTNAFNSLYRKLLIDTVEGSLLESYTKWAYGKLSQLFLSDSLPIKSQTVVQHGDPLGMTLFGITIEQAIQRVRELNPDVRILAYEDDIYLIGIPKSLERAANKIKEELSYCGLNLNTSKSQLWPKLNEVDFQNLLLLSTFNQNQEILSVLGIPIAGNIRVNQHHAIRGAGN